MKIERFEDLRIWQDSRSLTKSIYSLTSAGKFSKDFGLREQIQRSSVSIPSNIAEGYERRNNREFVNFLGYAKGSAGELRTQLYVAYDVGYITKEAFFDNINRVTYISQQLSNFIKYLKKHLP